MKVKPFKYHLLISIKLDRRVIRHAKFDEQANTFDKSFMIRSRLDAELDFLDGKTKFGKLTDSKAL